jgi:uncharacterized protein
MKYTTGSVGRIITIRFEDGDPIYEGIEEVAAKEEIESGMVWVIGGVKNGGVVVGPSSDAMPPVPMVERFIDPREIAGIGTIFTDDDGAPSLHMHASIGKGTSPLVGCPRKGLDCWLITEAVIMELNDLDARRMKDEKSGFTLLEVGVRL